MKRAKMLIRYRWFSQVNIKTLQLLHNSIFKEGKEEIDDTRSKSFFSKQKFIFEKQLQTDFVCALSFEFHSSKFSISIRSNLLPNFH